MPYRCLADFLEELGHAGELVRVQSEVDSSLEIAEITRREGRGAGDVGRGAGDEGREARGEGRGGPALLFGAVKGHDIPVLTNLLGSEARIARALGAASLEEAAERIALLVEPAGPEGWFERLKSASYAAPLGNLPPRRVRSGACQQVVRLGRDVNLDELPALRSAPEETGRTVTAGALVTADPDTHQQVIGRYDLQLLGPDRLAVCWAPHDEPARLLMQYRGKGEQMPLAVVLGGDPAVLLAASAMLPTAADRFALAGAFRQKALDVVPCRSVDLSVPAEAEIVVEGFVDPGEPAVEAGPRCTTTGHYGRPRPAPLVHVTAITHRGNPIFPAMVPGPPPHEAVVIDRALARLLRPLVRLAIPELADYDLPAFAAARHWATLAIRKSYAGQARQVASAAWGLRQFMFAKMVVVVDEDLDVHDIQQVLGAIAANANPGRDVFTQQGPPDPLDPAASAGTLGQRMAIDATRKLPEEKGEVN